MTPPGGHARCPIPRYPTAPATGSTPCWSSCVLAVASLVIAFLGATPARVSATELLGDPRMPGDAAFIASHRGGGATAPENTLPADHGGARRAASATSRSTWRSPPTATPCSCTTRKVDRTTNGTGRLAELTLAEVRALDAGSWFDPSFAGTTVPTLVEFLDVLAASGGRAIIELKGVWDAAAVDAARSPRSSPADLERDVAVASFDARTLALWAAETEVVSRLLILKHVPDDVVAAAEQAGVEGVIVNAQGGARAPGDRRRAARGRRSASSCTRSTRTRSGTPSPRWASTASSRTIRTRCSEWQSSSAGER